MNKSLALIDIGCNLTSKRLLADLDRVLREANEVGVIAQIITGTDLNTSEQSLALADEYPQLYATVGSHPHHANEWKPHSYPAAFQALARQTRVVAVGEMGLDYHRHFATPANQRKSFNDQLEIAKAVQKPVFLHERNAMDDFISILRPALPELKGGVWHCFTGDRAQLDLALELGLSIGITGWICDPQRGQTLRDIVKYIPDDRLMIETDAPYLTPKTLNPTPRTNEPKYLPEVLKILAQCRAQDISTLAAITTTNCKRFFNLPSIET